MNSEEISGVVDDIAEKFISRVKKYLPNYEKSRINTVSPFSYWGLRTTDSELKTLFRSEKSKRSQNSCLCDGISDLGDIVQAVKFALNNTGCYDDYKSYSSCLAIPLFKYKAKILSITQTNVDCVVLKLTLNCYSWVDINDSGDRGFTGDVAVHIPFKYIYNKEKCKEIILSSLDSISTYDDARIIDGMYDIDSIEYYDIVGFILDISGVGRKNLSSLVNGTKKSNFDSGLKLVASYKTDREVILYANDKDMSHSIFDVYTISDKLLVDLLKIYFILHVYNYPVGCMRLMEYIESHFALGRHRNALNLIKEYMDKNRDLERGIFNKFLDNLGGFYSRDITVVDELHKRGYISKESIEVVNNLGIILKNFW